MLTETHPVLSEIVSEVSRYERVDLGERETEFLGRIAEGANSSYKIFSHLKKMGQPKDYKNVNKRVRRLHELGLITKAKGESIHNAKFYAMTPEGIFYLLASRWIVTSDKSWIKNYKDNIVLRYLLEPYFEENTIEIPGIEFEIGKYLSECCQMILYCSSSIRSIPRLAQGKISKERLERMKEFALKQLQIDLEWQAKSLAFKLISSKRASFWYVLGYMLEKDKELVDTFLRRNIDEAQHFKDFPEHPANLVKDKKFMKFSKNLGKEYEKAFSSLVDAAQKSE